ncbi:MAG: dTMP kinase [Acidimicrobiales bacterium]
MTAKLIAFEGGEGTGKSTQARLLAERIDAHLTFEPGDTAVGARIRELVLDPSNTEIHARTEALLMAADRAQHVAEIISPAMAAGRSVVTDRYIGSSLVYQGRGRRLGVDAVAALSGFATAGLAADIVVLLEVDAVEANRRLGRELDRLEAAGDDFHERVRDGFATLAVELDWLVVDGDGPIDEVHERVWAAVRSHLDV